MKTLQLSVLLALGLVAACGGESIGGTNTGNALVSIRMGATQGPPQALSQVSGNDAQGTAFVITAARAYIRDIRFSLPLGTTCETLEAELAAPVVCDDNAIEIQRKLVVDLLADTAPAELEGIEVPPLDYRRVDVRFDDADDATDPVPTTDPLWDNTLVAQGTFAYQATTYPFELVLSFDEEASFEQPASLGLAPGKAADLLLALDVEKWFAAIPITACLDDGDLAITGGKLILQDSEGSCGEIEDAIKNAIKGSAELEREDEEEDD